MKATVLPAFEKEFKCTVSADQAFPFMPKLQASPKNDPLYDVCTPTPTSNGARSTEGLVMPKITAKEVPNVADVYPYAVSDKIVGVSIFTSAIGLGFRTDKGLDQADLVEGPRRSQARRRARRLHHPGQQPRPVPSDDAGQDLRQGPAPTSTPPTRRWSS